jgi:hypothetical protein
VGVPDDVGDRLADHPGQRLLDLLRKPGALPEHAGLDAGRPQHGTGPGELCGQVRGAQAADDPAHLPQGVLGQLADLEHLRDGTVLAATGQLRGELALDRDRRERAADDVVQVPGEP